MKSNDNEFVLLSEMARPGTAKHKKLRIEANRIGALVTMGDSEFVDMQRFLGHQAQTKQARIDSRVEAKQAAKMTAGRYGNIRSVAKLDIIHRQITKAINPRNIKIDQLSKAIDSEKDEATRGKLSAERNRLMTAAEDAEVKLEQVSVRKKEIEVANKALLEKRRKSLFEATNQQQPVD